MKSRIDDREIYGVFWYEVVAPVLPLRNSNDIAHDLETLESAFTDMIATTSFRKVEGGHHILLERCRVVG